MQPEAGVEYPLQLGASLLGKRGGQAGSADEFCTLRYDFKPASASRAAAGQLDVQLASQKVRAGSGGGGREAPLRLPKYWLARMPASGHMGTA